MMYIFNGIIAVKYILSYFLEHLNPGRSYNNANTDKYYTLY